MISRRITPERRGRQYLTAIAAVGLIAGSLLASGSALAVHDAGFFELDGNATNGAAPGDDWDNVCHQVTGSDCSTTSNTTGAVAVSFTAEPDPSATIFTGGGSKDPIDVSSWAWKNAGGLPDKDNLRDAFAARYQAPPSATCPAGTATVCDILYFGSDRFDNSGDAQQGFWFFQNRITLSNTKSGGGFAFTGVHRNGDVLIISDFSNGGTVSTISIYVWDSTVSGNLRLLLSSDAANCATAGAADAACGLVNGQDGTVAPWPFLDKSGNATYLQGELYEGGINLSTLGLSGECFSSVASETRSSTSTTATLKDFVLGQFATCAPTLTTSVSNQGPVLPGTAVHDTATVTINGATNPADATGTVEFWLCADTTAPFAAPDCSTGGSDIGSGNLVGGAVTNDGISTATSPDVNTAASALAPGYYCFAAVADLTNYDDPPRATNQTTECFQVAKLNPTIVTTSSSTGNVTPGTSVTDSTTVSGTGPTPTGTVDFILCQPSEVTSGGCEGTAGTKIGATKTLDAAGSATSDAASGSATTALGKYCWRVEYSGDGVYNPGSHTNAGSECFTVRTSTSATSAQNWLPNDQVVLSSASGNVPGTLSIQLIEGTLGTTCAGSTGTVRYTETAGFTNPVTATVAGTTINTTNATFKALASSSYYWRITFTPTNTNADGFTKCEATAPITINNNPSFP